MRRLLGAIVLVAATLVVAAPVQAVEGAAPAVEGSAVDLAGTEALPLTKGRLADGDLNALVAEIEATGGAGGESSVVVEIVTSHDVVVVADLVADVGGVVLGAVEGEIVLAAVPAASLEDLEGAEEVRYLRTPSRVDLEPAIPESAPSPVPRLGVVGEEVAKTNADAWHSVGITGAGVKIGIIDGFKQSTWQAAQSAGEVPAPVATRCRFNGASCSIWAADSDHGVGVAEIIHEMAPGAQIYLATAVTTADLQHIVNWFDNQGVHIISRSLGAVYDGRGNGTGPIDSVVASAVSKGMLFVNAAGNSAGVQGGREGSYWRDDWRDNDNDGWMNFASNDELLGFFACTGNLGLRWDDWGEGNKTDFDVYVADTPAAATAGNWQAVSLAAQGSGADPVEAFGSTCNGSGDVDYLAIRLFSPGANRNDTLEFQMNGLPMEYWQNPYSAAIPAVDSASNGMIAVGAVDPPLGGGIAPYSSRGPTNDGRKKPDLAVASGVDNFTYGTFGGTSAAAPAAAGAAALVRSAGLANTPVQLRNYLYNEATVDRGPGGVDNAFGHGELILPSPPSGSDDELHVADVRVILKEAQNRALGRVWVEDQAGTAVPGVTVKARWKVDGSPTPTTNKQTNTAGIAAFSYTDPPAGAELEICVENLTKNGYVYDEASNVLTCASDTWPGGGGPTLHVADAAVILKESQNRALGRIWVEDQDGTRVRGVTVTAEWTVAGTPMGNETKNTNASGIAVFSYDDPPAGAELRICVEDLAKNGYTYDAAGNVVTCASDSWPGGGDPTMHVKDVRIVLDVVGDRALGRVWVEDDTGALLPGVDVTAEWTVDGVAQGDSSKWTNVDGFAKFTLTSPPLNAELEICVSDLQLAGFTYAPDDNLVTCDSAMWPGGAPDSMHVGSIDLVVREDRNRVTAKVVIEDASSSSVAGADVDVDWSMGGTVTSDSATTNNKGRATSSLLNPTSGETVEVCVTDVTHTTLTYAPGDNAVTCAQVVYP